MTTTTNTTYSAIGDVRGNCGHEHRTIVAALECARRDHAGCKSQGGYSDRAVRHSDGSRLDGHEVDELADVECKE